MLAQPSSREHGMRLGLGLNERREEEEEVKFRVCTSVHKEHLDGCWAVGHCLGAYAYAKATGGRACGQSD
jgi:hypothetical protein